MKHSNLWMITVLSASLLIIAACTDPTVLNIPAEDFEIKIDSLPQSWEESRSIRGGWDGIALEEWQQRWAPANTQDFAGFVFSIGRYETVSQAKGGYRLSLRKLRETRYTIGPRPEWGYESPHADQYEVVCSPPDTMGEGCVAIGRYVNMVVMAGIEPDEDLLLTSAPGLFEEIDRQVQGIIKANQDN